MGLSPDPFEPNPFDGRGAGRETCRPSQFPRIEDRQTKTLEILYVARRYRKAMLLRGGRDPAIGHAEWPASTLPLTLRRPTFRQGIV